MAIASVMRYALACAALFPFLVLTGCGEKQSVREIVFSISRGGKEVILVGSLHSVRKNMMPPTAKLDDLFMKSEALALEINFGSQVEDLMSAYGADSDAFSHFPPEVVAKAKAAIDSEFPEAVQKSALRRPPAVIYRMLQGAPRLRVEGQVTGLDFHFYFKAKELKRPILELEGIDQFAKSEREVPDSLMARKIAAMAELATDDKKVRLWKEFNQRLQDLFGAGDADGLYIAMRRFNMETLGLPEEAFTREVDARNVAMADRVDTILDGNQRVFAIVGVAHLGGANGIPELLRRRGATVKRLDLN